MDQSLIIMFSCAGLSLFCCGALVAMCLIHRYQKEKAALIAQIRMTRRNPDGNITNAEIYGLDEQLDMPDFYGRGKGSASKMLNTPA